MIQLGKESGYTLTELMIVIAIVGVLAVPQAEQVKTQARLVGVQANYRSVLTTLYGMENTSEVEATLKDHFGEWGIPEAEDMANPLTNKTGVATSLAFSSEGAPAVYVLDQTASPPTRNGRTDYKGAVVAIVRSDNKVVLYGCDEKGEIIRGLQRTISF